MMFPPLLLRKPNPEPAIWKARSPGAFPSGAPHFDSIPDVSETELRPPRPKRRCGVRGRRVVGAVLEPAVQPAPGFARANTRRANPGHDRHDGFVAEVCVVA